MNGITIIINGVKVSEFENRGKNTVLSTFNEF